MMPLFPLYNKLQLVAPQQFSPVVLAPDPTIYTRPIPSPTLDEIVSVLPAPLTLAPQEIHETG